MEEIGGEDGQFGPEQARGGTGGTRSGGQGASLLGEAEDGQGGGDNCGGGGGGAGIIRINAPADELVIGAGVLISPPHTRGDITID